jgi:CBS domain-containing protein
MSLMDMPVGSMMTKPVKTIRGASSLEECVKLMREAKIGCVVVSSEDRPVGIFTERDLVRIIADGGVSMLSRSMNEVMTKPLTTILSGATVWDAMALMGRRSIRHLPVVERGRLVGMLSERDVLKLILSHQKLILEEISESIPAATRARLKETVFPPLWARKAS